MDLHAVINDSYKLIKDKKYDLALKNLLPLLGHYRVCNVVQLVGAAYLGKKSWSEALKYFAYALSLEPKNPELHNQIAQSYSKLGYYSKAELHFKAAISLKTDYFEACVNLIELYIDTKQYAQFDQLVFSQNIIAEENEDLLCSVRDAYRVQNKFESALKWYQKVLQVNQDSLRATHNLAICFRMLGDVEKSLEILQICNIDSSHLRHLEALCLYDAGSFNKSRTLLESLHIKNINKVSYLEALAELDWQCDEANRTVERYQKLLNKKYINHEEILISFITILIQSENYKELENLLSKISKQCSLKLNAYVARAYSKLGKFDLALPLYELIARSVNSFEFKVEYAEFLILAGYFSEAETILMQLYSGGVFNQKVLGLLGSMWRERGDERYYWLNDYDRFIDIRTIEKPNEYLSLEHYLNELQDVVLSMHISKKEPLTQSVRNGSQSSGRFFSKNIPIIKTHVQALNKQIKAFLCKLPINTHHPFLQRNTKSYRFSGSWSVALKDGGFHVSHVHPEGWISSAFYVSTVETEEQDGGNILFGRAPYKSLKINSVEREIKPEPGILVLFPSYFWHETKPFHNKNINDDSKRITTPFDLVPG
ncbi:putative 2OG-Fe(II) oxygenase [Sessilibacter sp. MAH4]